VAFSTGQTRVIITKPSIAGYGLNWQHCARMAFVGLSFSYENYYQAIRRCWRFGQTRPVQVHIACADTEENIWQTVSRKADDHDTMKRAMSQAMARAVKRAAVETYNPKKTLQIPTWMQS
jgi:SNF2 family DNA or RNA helicase